MRSMHASHAADAHLRVIFDDHRVVSLNPVVDITFGEVAETVNDLRERYGDPLAIDVILTPRRERAGSQTRSMTLRISRARSAIRYGFDRNEAPSTSRTWLASVGAA